MDKFFKVGDWYLFDRERGEFYSGIRPGEIVEITSVSPWSVSVQSVARRGAHLAVYDSEVLRPISHGGFADRQS